MNILKKQLNKPGCKKIFFAATLFLFTFLFFGTALALEVGWPKSPFGTDIMDLDKKGDLNIAVFIKYIYEWGIALGGVATFIAFVIAGFQYIISVGNPQTMKDAMDRIKSAVFGLVLLLSAWIILNTINEELISFKLQPFSPKAISDFFQTCNEEKNKNCDEGMTCVRTKEMIANKEDGICVATMEEGIICDSATLYSETGFSGTQAEIKPDQTITISPKSVRAKYTDKKTGTTKYCDQMTAKDLLTGEEKTTNDNSGCGCVLQLFAAQQAWVWTSCGDKIADVTAYNQDLTRTADRDVYCVRLVAPQIETAN